MSSPLDAISRVVAAFERSDWAEIDVRMGDVRVHLAAGAPTGIVTSSAPAHAAATPTVATDDTAATTTSAAAVTAAPVPPAGAHVVVSPSPGIFWRSPEPGAPPFADVGDTVDTSTTLCIVEVMKLMNHIKADLDGEVVAVYGSNGVAVQQGEPLFAIAPAGTAR